MLSSSANSLTTPNSNSSSCTAQLELTLSCRQLRNADLLSKSDPFCLVLQRDPWAVDPSKAYYQIGRTETIRDCLSPEWVQKIVLDYNFEYVQQLRFEVWDEDPGGKRDFLGAHETTVADIVASMHRQYVRPLRGFEARLQENGTAPSSVSVSKNRGQIVIFAEEPSSCKKVALLDFAVELPASLGLTTSSNGSNFFANLFNFKKHEAAFFLVLSRCNEDGTYSVVFKTSPAVVAKTQISTSKTPEQKSNSPPSNFLLCRWPPFHLRLRTLCNGDLERSIRLDVYRERKRSGDHKLIGSATTSVSEMTDGQALSMNSTETYSSGPIDKIYRLEKRIDPSKRDSFYKKKSQPLTSSSVSAASQHTPTLHLGQISLSNEITFLDYIRSGTQMHFAVAIDFTASNGPPNDPRSLHYIDVFRPANQNPYQIALHAVGEIVAKYNTTGMFPAFGFGAKLPSNSSDPSSGGDQQVVSHLFPLNGNREHPYCVNVAEIEAHYRKCLATVTLHGPTHFRAVVENTAKIAAEFANGQHYFVLLILTDGIINDMQQTKLAIIRASAYPISIVIVGVGSADFSAMNELDSDDRLLSATEGGGSSGNKRTLGMVSGSGRTVKAVRDIVQFVPLNKFLAPPGPAVSTSSSSSSSAQQHFSAGVRCKAELAREVLAEIPDQMTAYMRLKGVVPEVLKKDWI